MKTKIWIFCFTGLLLILACGGQSYNPPQPFYTNTNSTIPSMTPLPTSLPTSTLIPTDTAAPTEPPTLTLTASAVATDTVSPPLPDFDQVINFAMGGGSLCGGMKFPQTKVRVINGRAFVCFRDTLGMLQLIWYAPDGRTYTTSSIDTTSLTEYIFRWPLTIPAGQSRLHIYGNGYSEDVDFMAMKENEGYPQIAMVDAGSRNEINGVYQVALKDNGKLDVSGLYYPANVPIYVLVYRYNSGREFDLIHKQAVQSDAAGSIYAELTVPFEVGKTYISIGISDPATKLKGSDGLINDQLPQDYFYVAPPRSSSSCPNAPPQHMLVNQRGYVCTHGDGVWLRDAASQKANRIVEFPNGSPFTVVGGPSCSDNWSWWQVKSDDGYTGWISEGGDAIDPYFICPSP